MKVLFISHDAARTGAPLLLLNLIRHLKDCDVQPTVLLRRGGPLADAFAELGPVIEISQYGDLPALRVVSRWIGAEATHDRVLARILRRRLEQEKFALAYSNTITNGIIHDLLRKLGIPILTHVHELGYWMDQVLRPNILQKTLSQSDRFVACSNAVKHELIKHAVPASKVTVLHSFIDVKALHSLDKNNVSAILRRRLRVSEQAILVGGSGTIGWRKGTDLFVQVAAAMRRQHPNLPLHFVWFGSELEHGDIGRLRHDASLGGIESMLSFTGHLDDADSLLAGLDVLLLTSREDPFPLVMLEAAVGMTPMVAFAGTGGAEEFASDGAGIIVQPLDTSAMASAAISLLDNKSWRNQMALTAKARVEQLFNLQVVAPQIYCLMNEVAKEHSTR